MERDQHSSGEQTPGGQNQREGADRAEKPGTPAAVPEPDAIMSKLPRTRPQRVTGRRQRNPASSEASVPPNERKTRRSAAAQRTATARKPRGGAAATRSSPGPPRRRPAVTAQPSSEPAPAPRGSSRAPGLPRLAMDGAVEAAKLPLKVGGRLTLRALDAVARSLRGE